MSEEVLKLIITDEDHNNFKRLDAYLADKCTDISRTNIKKLFEQGKIKSTQKLEIKKLPPIGTEINIIIPEPAQTNLIAENIPLEILYEDEYLMIINKPAGLVVHPAPGNYTGTLVNAILFHCDDLKGIGHEMRPGIVHRLDKGTSGVMVVAKEQTTHTALVELFSSHNIERKYEAICLGTQLPDKDTAKSLIGRNPGNRLKMTSKVTNGKEAITHLKVLEGFKYFSHIELTLETGRTHQIRVHMSELYNSPLLNDHTYGRIKEERRLYSTEVKHLLLNYEHPFLHAKILGFKHPKTKQNLFFETAPPDIFITVLNQLRQDQ